jgi:hypothetical protein
MPRRRGNDVFDAAVEATRIRWRFAVRNPGFRSELKRLGDLYFKKEPSFEQEFRQFRREWAFPMIPLRALTGFRDVPAEEIVSPFLDAMDATVVSLPVVTFERVEGSPWVWVMVDTTFPLDMLVSAFETEARDLVEKGGRRRYDKARFYLEVFDRASRGGTFAAIATAVGRPVATVKSAFVAANRIIFGASPGKPSKKTAPLVGFEPDTHFEKCRTCRSAQSIEEFCPAARGYVQQDEVSQRDRLK